MSTESVSRPSTIAHKQPSLSGWQKHLHAPIPRSTILILLLSLCTFSSFSQSIIWEEQKSPLGGTLPNLAIDTSGFLYGGHRTGIVFKSTDHGEHWSQLGERPTLSRITSIHVTRSGDVIIGSEDYGMYRWNAGSWEWVKVDSAPSGRIIMVFCEPWSETLLAGTTSGLRRSTDDGRTWATHSPDFLENVLALVSDQSGRLYAGTDDGVFVSDDTGNSWTSSNTGLTSLVIRTLYAMGDTILTGTLDGLFISTNRGSTWERIESLAAQVITTVSGDAQLCVAGGLSDTIFVSRDHARTWSARATNLGTHFEVLKIDNNGRILAGTAARGLLFSDDQGSTWKAINANWDYVEVRSLALLENGSLLAGTSAGLFRKQTADPDWEFVRFPNSVIDRIQIDSLGNYWIQTASGRLRTSTNAGLTWNNISIEDAQNITFLVLRSGVVLASVLSWSDPDGGVVYRSDDHGNNWSKVQGLEGAYVRSLFSDSDGHVFAGSDSIFKCVELGTYSCWWFRDGLYRSTDDGLTWTASGLDSISIATINGGKSGKLYVGSYYEGFFVSTDHGQNWERRDWGLPWLIISVILPMDDGKIIIGTHRGIFFSQDDGLSWLNENTGLDTSLGQIASTGIILDQSNHLLVSAGTKIYRTRDPLLSVETEQMSEPITINLIHIYPNPFNSETTILIPLEKSGHLRLSVYDVLGREIRTLVDSEVGRGNFETVWEPDGLATGMYFLRGFFNEKGEERRVMVASSKVVLMN